MRAIILAAVVGIDAAALLLQPPVSRAFGYGCGIPPIPPIGCSSQDAECFCDVDGNCQWVFVGCR